MITAKDLLYKALDYDGFWNSSKRMMNSKPSQSRKLQLDKLLDVFEILKTNFKTPANTNPRIESLYSISGSSKSLSREDYIKQLPRFKYFTFGEFIIDAPKEKYRDVLARITSTVKHIFPKQTRFIDENPVNLVRLFSDLYQFKLTFYQMTKYNFSKKRLAKFSTEDDYALYLRNRFIESMDTHLSEIDEILCSLIDPEKRILNENEIGYPDFDLKAIDAEWEKEIRSQ